MTDKTLKPGHFPEVVRVLATVRVGDTAQEIIRRNGGNHDVIKVHLRRLQSAGLLHYVSRQNGDRRGRPVEVTWIHGTYQGMARRAVQCTGNILGRLGTGAATGTKEK